jgi:hypothetical protein
MWANKILKEYLIKVYSMNEKLLKNQNEKLTDLKESIKLLGKITNLKELSKKEMVYYTILKEEKELLTMH